MLDTLTISNYVIIDQAEIRFMPGLNMITGETGAGKSILLGALGLVLGRRADTQVLLDSDAKVVIEAVFNDTEHRVTSLLQSYDLDNNDNVMLRREISANGRSRAFVNDTPVTLDTMTEIGAALVDVHQQFEALDIQQTREQYEVLDAFCGLQSQTVHYQADFRRYSDLQSQLEELHRRQANATKRKRLPDVPAPRI